MEKFSYLDINPKESPAIIVLHGMGMSKETMLKWISPILINFRYLILDLPGHNGVDATNVTTISDYAKYVKDFADSLKVTNYFIFGFSFGGLIATKYSELYNKDLTGTIVWASPLKPDQKIIIASKALKMIPQKMYSNLNSDVNFVRLLNKLGIKGFSNDDLESISKMKKIDVDKICDIISNQIDKNAFNFSFRKKSLFVFGTPDPLVSNNNYNYLSEIKNKNIKVIKVLNGGHFGTKEGHKKALEEINKFLSSSSTSTSTSPTPSTRKPTR